MALPRRRKPRGRSSKNETALAGEYFVLGEMATRGLVGTLTLGTTKGIDILVLNPHTGKVFTVEVKTTRMPPRREGAFGFNYMWLVTRKLEQARGRDLVYAFVRLEGLDADGVRPRIFFVPSREVSRYVRWQHKRFRRWQAARARKRGTTFASKTTTTRAFRIPSPEETEPQVPPAWRDARWKRWEGGWRAAFGPLPKQ